MLRDAEGRGLSPPVEVGNMTFALGLSYMYNSQAKKVRRQTFYGPKVTDCVERHTYVYLQ
jgi:hypothetical protein